MDFRCAKPRARLRRENEELRLRLVRLSERAGTRVRGIYKWHLSEKRRKANAALTGLGATRRIPDGTQVAVDGVAGIVRWMR